MASDEAPDETPRPADGFERDVDSIKRFYEDSFLPANR